MSMRIAACGQKGGALLWLVIAIVLLIGALGFGGWAYAGMLNYKNNTAAIVAKAVVTAKQQEDKAKDAAFAETEKSPLRTYAGPAAYGSVTVQYPKTWSAYIIDTHNNSPYIDGYFYPGTVPDTVSQNSTFALRIQLVQDSYSNVLNNFTGNVKQGLSRVQPYAAPKVPNVIGVRVDGKLMNNKSGTMVVLPLRNMTLELWTEAPQFQNDFVANILPNFTFAP